MKFFSVVITHSDTRDDAELWVLKKQKSRKVDRHD
jgi:hypothetical protein